MNSEIERAIAAIIAEELGVDPARVTPEARLREDLGADSINAVQIAWEIEERFSIEIPETDLQNARTVAQIVDYVTETVRAGVPQTP